MATPLVWKSPNQLIDQTVKTHCMAKNDERLPDLLIFELLNIIQELRFQCQDNFEYTLVYNNNRKVMLLFQKHRAKRQTWLLNCRRILMLSTPKINGPTSKASKLPIDTLILEKQRHINNLFSSFF